MTANGHRLTTLAFGGMSIAFLYQSPSLLPVNQYEAWGWLVLYGLTLMIGATSPDYLEFARYQKNLSGGRDKRVSLIPHRTLTHWPILWLIPLYFVLTLPMEWYYQAAGAGFLISGLLHIAMDSLSKSGIPLLLPMAKYRVKIPLYSTGKASEALMVLVIFALFSSLSYLTLQIDTFLPAVKNILTF